MKKAIWGQEYDMHTDRIYNCPSCPDCNMPIFDFDKKICYGCGEEVELTDDMVLWNEERTDTKEEITKCLNCGNKTMKVVSRRNYVNKEWQVAFGECECGCRFIV